MNGIPLHLLRHLLLAQAVAAEGKAVVEVEVKAEVVAEVKAEVVAGPHEAAPERAEAMAAKAAAVAVVVDAS